MVTAYLTGAVFTLLLITIVVDRELDKFSRMPRLELYLAAIGCSMFWPAFIIYTVYIYVKTKL